MITFGTMRGGISNLMFSRDGSQLFMTGSGRRVFEAFDLASGKRVSLWAGERGRYGSWFELLAVRQDFVLLAQDGRIIQFRFAEQVSERWPPLDYDGRPQYCATAGGDVILCRAGDRFARIGPDSGTVSWSPPASQPVQFGWIDTSPAGDLVCVRTWVGIAHGVDNPENRVRVYRSDTADLVFDSGRLPAMPYAVAVSWDSARLAAAVGQSIFIFHIADGSRVRHRSGDRKSFSGIQFVSGDRHLLRFRTNSIIQTIDVGTGEVVSELEPGIGRIHHLIVSPDRTMAAASGSRNKVAIWDLEP
ncbi:MAG: WD40 repeat domain-containing protein [Gemmataceae bacterium]|nr:WD40 repeat domain-containing protein [Gemmataceae bacterium]